MTHFESLDVGELRQSVLCNHSYIKGNNLSNILIVGEKFPYTHTGIKGKFFLDDISKYASKVLEKKRQSCKTVKSL